MVGALSRQQLNTLVPDVLVAQLDSLLCEFFLDNIPHKQVITDPRINKHNPNGIILKMDSYFISKASLPTECGGNDCARVLCKVFPNIKETNPKEIEPTSDDDPFPDA